MKKTSTLVLSDGTRLQGEHIGSEKAISGEMVFSTAMVGYGEAITDPSYYGQILVFTYPLIGNYGIPGSDKNSEASPKGLESKKANASGVIITVDCSEAFHWSSTQTLDEWLKSENVPGIMGVDTRHLVHLIRSTPRLLGKIIPEGMDETAVPTFYDPGNEQILRYVSRSEKTTVGKGDVSIGLIDCGVKWNIVRQLIENGCEVQILPWNTNPKEVSCDGWLISNGPGNPENTENLIPNVKTLLDDTKPILGICLGHQILALAAGAKTERMNYGHRSHNQPVRLVNTRNGFITSQNHGYVVKEESLPEAWEPWFLNANDETVEGIKHKTHPYMSVQFHPEAAGGPRDTGWIIKDFVDIVRAKL